MFSQLNISGEILFFCVYTLLFLTVLQYSLIGSAFSAECHQHVHLRNLLKSNIKRVFFFVFSFALWTLVPPKKIMKQIKMVI